MDSDGEMGSFYETTCEFYQHQDKGFQHLTPLYLEVENFGVSRGTGQTRGSF
jgi:hypothetical protein